MTDDRMALVDLIEQGADSDLVRDMLAFAAERDEPRRIDVDQRFDSNEYKRARTGVEYHSLAHSAEWHNVPFQNHTTE